MKPPIYGGLSRNASVHYDGVAMNESPETTAPPTTIPDHPPTQRGHVPPKPAPAKSVKGSLFWIMLAMIAVLYTLIRSSSTGQMILVTVLGSFVAWLGLALFKPTQPIAMAPILLVIGPFLFRRQVIDVSAEIEDIGDIPHAAAETLRAALSEIADDFHRSGFTPTGVWRVGKSQLKIASTIYAQTYSKPGNACAAVVLFMMSEQGAMQGRPVIRISSKIATDEHISVHNATYLHAYPVKQSRSARLPKVTAVAELLQVHQAMLRKFAPGARHTHPAAAGWPAYFRAGDQADLERWQKGGYVKQLAPRVFGTTWKGALRATFVMTWPAFQIRESRDQRRMRLLLREIGV